MDIGSNSIDTFFGEEKFKLKSCKITLGVYPVRLFDVLRVYSFFMIITLFVQAHSDTILSPKNLVFISIRLSFRHAKSIHCNGIIEHEGQPPPLVWTLRDAFQACDGWG